MNDIRNRLDSIIFISQLPGERLGEYIRTSKGGCFSRWVICESADMALDCVSQAFLHAIDKNIELRASLENMIVAGEMVWTVRTEVHFTLEEIDSDVFLADRILSVNHG
jgi:hypothetical protein